MVTVSKAGTDLIPAIRQLANKTWKVAYADILSPQQMEYMLQMFYSEASLNEQMKHGHQFIVAFENNTFIGFASYSPKSALEPRVFRLHKLYIDPIQQGKRVGKTLIDFIIADIKTASATSLELNVNRHNKALHFYSKLGFTIVKEEDIDIGQGYFMNDYVMELNL